MINPGMMSSNTDDWATPQAFFDKVSAEFGPFDVDVCASSENAKAPKFFSREQDGLKQEWAGKVWMNPPYGREIKHWVKKASESARGGGNCGLPRSRKDGHGLVVGFRSRQGRSAVYPWPIAFRERQGKRSFPLRAGYLPAGYLK